ncbi:MAG: hypothetical protein K6F64_00570 [Clostridia bacterium]|nr:hypothetical protein [Clostridia bacterium]
MADVSTNIQEQETDDFEIPDTVIHSLAFSFWQMMQNEMKDGKTDDITHSETK